MNGKSLPAFFSRDEMMVRQFILLAIAVAVPALCLSLNRRRFLLGWIGLTLFVHVFDTAVVTNLPAGRVVGLLYLPIAIVNAAEWLKSAPARAWLFNLVYLVVLGVLFGFIWPWPDISGARPFTLRSQGRTIIYLARLIADVSLTVFVMNSLKYRSNMRLLIKWMTVGAGVTAAFGIIGFLTKVDFYLLVTGLRGYVATGIRPRGLSFEPRGLGLACAYGLLLLLLKERRSSWEWALAIVTAAGLVLAFSTSAFAAFLVGLAVVLLFGSLRSKALSAVVVAIGMLSFAALSLISPELVEQGSGAVVSRVEGRGTPESNVSADVKENLALRLDVFDASAALFLLRNPIYALIGTGPGLVSLPASSHVPEGVYASVFPTGIDSLPTHGLLHEAANSGLVGVIAWLLGVWWSDRALREASIRDEEFRYRRGVHALGALLFLVQLGPSPVWAVFRSIGWRACKEARSDKSS